MAKQSKPTRKPAAKPTSKKPIAKKPAAKPSPKKPARRGGAQMGIGGFEQEQFNANRDADESDASSGPQMGIGGFEQEQFNANRDATTAPDQTPQGGGRGAASRGGGANPNVPGDRSSGRTGRGGKRI
jgi:hypothetical protein